MRINRQLYMGWLDTMDLMLCTEAQNSSMLVDVGKSAICK